MMKGARDMHPVPLVSFSFSFDLTNYYLQLRTTTTTTNGETQHSRMRMQWQGLVCIFISFFLNCTYPWIDNADSHYSTSTQVTQRLPMGLRHDNKIDARGWGTTAGSWRWTRHVRTKNAVAFSMSRPQWMKSSANLQQCMMHTVFNNFLYIKLPTTIAFWAFF